MSAEDPLDVDEIRAALQNNDPATAAAKIQSYLDQQNKIPLNIGITGETGSGKSTFVNAIRGLRDEDEGAALTDVVETTMEVTAYPHPDYPNVTFWDLPGIGTTKFPADKYLQHVGFEKFDFFIIISDTRFRENDVKLALEIKRMEKTFYFVRSKIDDNMRAEKRSKKEFNEKETLDRIRKNCIQGLQNQGVETPQVFLVSSFELHLFDFSILQETLERELPAHKRNVLLFAMPRINLEIINKKKEAFQSRIEHCAALSALGAAVPVPGLSVFLDLTLLVKVVKEYTAALGLDLPSLLRLSGITGVPLSDLTDVIKSPLAAKIITFDLMKKALAQIPTIVLLTAAEELCSFIPLLGLLPAMILSAVTTYKSLNYFLDTLAEDAQRVFKRALGLNTSV